MLSSCLGASGSSNSDQCIRQQDIQLLHLKVRTRGRRHPECAQLFARQQCSRHFQKGHQWVPLLSTLSLRHKALAHFVGPLACGRLPHEWHLWHRVKSPQHGGPQDVIVGSDAIDGENRQTGVGIGGGPEHVPDAVGASSRGQGVLEWRAFLFKCRHELFASALATKRHNVQPVAMPLIPPSGLDNAVIGALVNASLTSSGTFPFAIRLQTATNKSVASLSSRRTFKCSYVHPPGPPEEPQGELRRLSKNVLRSNSCGVWGSNSRTSGGNSLRWNCGLLACSSRNVSSHFGARHAPVKHCRARDTSPTLTFWQAALALCSGVRCPDVSGARLRNASLVLGQLISRLGHGSDKLKSFHPLTSVKRSRCSTAVCIASNATFIAYRYIPFRCAGQLCNTLNLV